MPFGNDPITEKLILSKDADFVHTINAEDDEDFPANFTAAWLVLTPGKGDDTELATWDAEDVSTTAVSWIIQADTADTGVNAMYTAGAAWFRLYIRFSTSPTQEFLWYCGRINWKQ